MSDEPAELSFQVSSDPVSISIQSSLFARPRSFCRRFSPSRTVREPGV